MSSNGCLVTGPRYVAVAVENFDEVLAFYRDVWGLKVVRSETNLAYLAAAGDAEPFILRLRGATEKRLDIAAFSCASRADVDQLASRLEAGGVEIVAQPAELDSPGGGYGLRFFDCDGRLIEISADVHEREPDGTNSSGVPQGLSHIVFNSTNLERTLDFYLTKVGLRLSDRLEDLLCFVRGATTQHHIMALARGPHHAINHISFEMGSIDSLMRGAGRLKRTGRPVLWGPGRHGAGDNVFSYFTDPAGNVCEMSTELEDVPESGWEVRTFKTDDVSQDSWGVSERVALDMLIPTMANTPDPGLWKTPPI